MLLCCPWWLLCRQLKCLRAIPFFGRVGFWTVVVLPPCVAVLRCYERLLSHDRSCFFIEDRHGPRRRSVIARGIAPAAGAAPEADAAHMPAPVPTDVVPARADVDVL